MQGPRSCSRCRARKPGAGFRGKAPNVDATGHAVAAHPTGARLVRCREAERLSSWCRARKPDAGVSGGKAPMNADPARHGAARIQSAQGWAGSRGRNAPRRGCRGAKAHAWGAGGRPHAARDFALANPVSAPFSLRSDGMGRPIASVVPPAPQRTTLTIMLRGVQISSDAAR